MIDDEPEHLPLGDAGGDHALGGDDRDNDRRDDVGDAGAREVRHERAVAVRREPVGEGQEHSATSALVWLSISALAWTGESVYDRLEIVASG